jgi:hypothetical protein
MSEEAHGICALAGPVFNALRTMTCVRLRWANRTYRAAFDLAFDSDFESNSHVALPIVRGGKWIRSEAV